MTSPKDVRVRLVRTLRRDLIGPGPLDADLATELLDSPPSRWYLTGFLAPHDEAKTPDDDPDANDELSGVDTADDMDGAAEPATLDGQADGSAAKRKFLPSSLGLSFLLEPEVLEIDVEVSWGDYFPEPPLENEGLYAKDALDEGETAAEASRAVTWRRRPVSRPMKVLVPRNGRADPIRVPDSASPVRKGGGLELVIHAKETKLPNPTGDRAVRSVALFLVNRRPDSAHHFRDVTYVFQAGLKVRCGSPIVARTDMSGYMSNDLDQRIADLHYGKSCEYAVGRNTSAGWAADAEGQVHTIWTESLPSAQVERVAPNLDIADVTFGMEDLADAAAADAAALAAALDHLPSAYGAWIKDQTPGRFGITAPRRVETAGLLRQAMVLAEARISSGIERLKSDERCRRAFGLMNRAMANAARRRVGIERNVPPASDESSPSALH